MRVPALFSVQEHLMKRSSPTRQRLGALSLLGIPFLTYPLLGVPNGVLFGLPATYVYLFGVWATLIGLALWIAEGQNNK